MRAFNSLRILIPIILLLIEINCVLSRNISENEGVNSKGVKEEKLSDEEKEQTSEVEAEIGGKSSSNSVESEEGIRRFDAVIDEAEKDIEQHDQRPSDGVIAKVIAVEEQIDDGRLREKASDDDTSHQERSVKRKLDKTENSHIDAELTIEKKIVKESQAVEGEKNIKKSIENIQVRHIPELIPVKIDHVRPYENAFGTEDVARKSLGVVDDNEEKNDEDEQEGEVRSERSSEKKDEIKEERSESIVQKWKQQAITLQGQLKNRTFFQYLKEQTSDILPDIPKFTETQLLNALKTISSKKSTLSGESYIKNMNTSMLNDEELEILKCAEGLIAEKQRQSFSENIFECVRGLNILNCMRIFVWPIIAENVPERIIQNFPTLPIEVSLSDFIPGRREEQSTNIRGVHQQRLLMPETVIANILKDALASEPQDENIPTQIDPENFSKLLTPGQLDILQMAEKFLPESVRQEYSSKMHSCVRRFEYFSCVKYFTWPMVKKYYSALPEFPDYQSWYPSTISAYPGYPIVPFPDLSGNNGQLPEVIEADGFIHRTPRPDTIIFQLLKSTVDEQPRHQATATIYAFSDDNSMTSEQQASIQMAQQLVPAAYRAEFVDKTIKCIQEYNYFFCTKYSTWPTLKQFQPRLPAFSDLESVFGNFFGNLPSFSSFFSGGNKKNYTEFFSQLPWAGSWGGSSGSGSHGSGGSGSSSSGGSSSVSSGGSSGAGSSSGFPSYPGIGGSGEGGQIPNFPGTGGSGGGGQIPNFPGVGGSGGGGPSSGSSGGSSGAGGGSGFPSYPGFGGSGGGSQIPNFPGAGGSGGGGQIPNFPGTGGSGGGSPSSGSSGGSSGAGGGSGFPSYPGVGGSGGGGQIPNFPGAGGSGGGIQSPDIPGAGGSGGGSQIPNFPGAGGSGGGSPSSGSSGGSSGAGGGSGFPSYPGVGGSGGGGQIPNLPGTGGSGGGSSSSGSSGGSSGAGGGSGFPTFPGVGGSGGGGQIPTFPSIVGGNIPNIPGASAGGGYLPGISNVGSGGSNIPNPSGGSFSWPGIPGIKPPGTITWGGSGGSDSGSSNSGGSSSSGSGSSSGSAGSESGQLGGGSTAIPVLGSIPWSGEQGSSSSGSGSSSGSSGSGSGQSGGGTSSIPGGGTISWGGGNGGSYLPNLPSAGSEIPNFPGIGENPYGSSGSSGGSSGSSQGSGSSGESSGSSQGGGSSEESSGFSENSGSSNSGSSSISSGSESMNTGGGSGGSGGGYLPKPSNLFPLQRVDGFPEPLFKGPAETLQQKTMESRIIDILYNLRYTIPESSLSPIPMSGSRAVLAQLSEDQMIILSLAKSIIPPPVRSDFASQTVGCLQGGSNFMGCTKYVIWPFLKFYIPSLPAFPEEQSQAMPIMIEKHSSELDFIPGRHYSLEPVSYAPFIGQSQYPQFFRQPIQILGRSPVRSDITAKADDQPIISVTDPKFVPIYTDHPDTVVLKILSAMADSVKQSTPADYRSRVPAFITFYTTLNTSLNDEQERILKTAEYLIPESSRQAFFNEMLICLIDNAFQTCARDNIWPALAKHYPRIPTFPNFQENALQDSPSPSEDYRRISETDVKTGQHGDTVVTITDTRFVPIFSEHPEEIIMKMLKSIQPSSLNQVNTPPSSIAKSPSYVSTFTKPQGDILVIAENLLPESIRDIFVMRMSECVRDSSFLDCTRDIAWPTIGQFFPRLPSYPNFGTLPSLAEGKPKQPTLLPPALDQTSPTAEFPRIIHPEHNQLEQLPETLESKLEGMLASISGRRGNIQSRVSYLNTNDPLTAALITDKQVKVIRMAEGLIPEDARPMFIVKMMGCIRGSGFPICSQAVAWPTLRQYIPNIPEFPDISNFLPEVPEIPEIPTFQEPLPELPSFPQFGQGLNQGSEQFISQFQQPVKSAHEFLGTQHGVLLPGYTASVGSASVVPAFPGQPTDILIDISQDRVILPEADGESLKRRRREVINLLEDKPTLRTNEASILNITESDLLLLLANATKSNAEELSEAPEESFLESLNSTTKESLTPQQLAILKMVEKIGVQNTRGVMGQVIRCVTGLSFIRCLGIFMWPVVTSAVPSLLGIQLPFGRSVQDSAGELFGISTEELAEELLVRKEEMEHTLLDWYKSLTEEKFESTVGFIKFEGYGDGEIGIKFTEPREGRAKFKDHKNMPSILTIISDIMGDVLDTGKGHHKSKKDKRIAKGLVLSLNEDSERSMNDDNIIDMLLQKIKTNSTDDDLDTGNRRLTPEDAYHAFETLLAPRLKARLVNKLEQLYENDIGSDDDNYDQQEKQDGTSESSQRVKVIPLKVQEETTNIFDEMKKEQDNYNEHKFTNEEKTKSALIIHLPKLNEEILSKKMADSLTDVARHMNQNNMIRIVPGIGFAVSFILQMALAHARAAASMATMLSNMAMGTAMFSLIRQAIFGQTTHPKIKYVYDTDAHDPGISWSHA